jgi:aminoglycoside phosphotransferase (APT) family kinase protein
MHAAEVRRAVATATTAAIELGLAVEASVVLSDSNRLVVRLLPCDAIARITPPGHHASAAREVEVVRLLERTDSPIAGLDARVDPSVHLRDGFQITLWTSLEHSEDQELPPAQYAGALERLHAGLRQIDVAAPHCMDRADAIERDAADPAVTPDLTDADRALLTGTLREVGRSILDRRAPEQLLHGEPHPWNLLRTSDGPRFIDFENAVRGPLEYDLGWVPDEVSQRYPGADPALVDQCRGVVLAVIATHRWTVGDRHPSGRRSGVAFLDALRAGPPWPSIDAVTW